MMGLTGLKNLKNSCYMSSSIQCLSHAIGLTNYFLRGHFKNELNYNNPLGAKG
jgi:ubiquitin C-terminal hydrolase